MPFEFLSANSTSTATKRPAMKAVLSQPHSAGNSACVTLVSTSLAFWGLTDRLRGRKNQKRLAEESNH